MRFSIVVDIDLSSNNLSGPLPLFPPYASRLILSQNNFSGPITYFCAMSLLNLNELDLSDNRLSGELPDCWMQFERLSVLNLANNKFSGKLPASLGSLTNINILHLSDNHFFGEMPSLSKCKGLLVLDVGENRISGNLTEWLVPSQKYLFVLLIGSNNFHGRIPTSFCSLEALRVIDLSGNHLSGGLPECIGNMTTMTSEVVSSFVLDHAKLVWKRISIVFGKNLQEMRSIDISNNHLSGEIPESTTRLLKLKSPNLSRNSLSGSIPGDFARLKDLESLDLSINQLSGGIPSSFSSLNFLGNLNLSYNRLEGKIPSGTQLQGFDASAYVGNRLYGPTLAENLPKNEPDDKNRYKDINNGDEDGYVSFGFYVSAAIGFIVGFWGFCGTLLLSTWRHAYFRFWNHPVDCVYVTTRVFKTRFLRRLKNENQIR